MLFPIFNWIRTSTKIMGCVLNVLERSNMQSSIRRTLKIREELTASRARVVQMTLNLPSPGKLQSEKRLLRSPATTQQSKHFQTQSLKGWPTFPTFDMLLEKAPPTKEKAFPSQTVLSASTEVLPRITPMPAQLYAVPQHHSILGKLGVDLILWTVRETI